jgi:hypothetical protein
MLLRVYRTLKVYYSNSHFWTALLLVLSVAPQPVAELFKG